MTYELCKKLKDAGFPQPEYPSEGNVLFDDANGSGYVCHQGEYCGAIPCTNCPKHDCNRPSSYEPTLSELIGETLKPFLDSSGLISLNLKYEWTINTRDVPAWSAILENGKGCGDETTRYIKTASGQTPEEAVANLWLELN